MRPDHPVLRHRARLMAEGFAGPWLAVFDIDSTLMDTTPRNKAILSEGLDVVPGLKEVWPRLDLDTPYWEILSPFRKAGIDDANLHSAVYAFWKERFFDDVYLRFDRPYPGTARYLHALKAEGFTLVYLSGRHSPGMEKGTRQSFADNGFPIDEIFLFKPSFEMPDRQFKESACGKISAMGNPVVTVDNEPANVNVFHAAFPHALSVWIDTVTSPRPETITEGTVKAGPEFFLDL